ncbi:IclR family transcriptional regulator [Ramlibacter sp. MAHUQ-53]|uniref:IclR family transcriptional regulator n=1 Tax=unclassified Ramlibacter TaxID=2617605 RepID=UPI003626F7DB
MNPDRYLRTFDILDLLVSHKEGLRLTEIKEALQLPVSSVHNMLQTMVTAEVAVVDDDLRYFVGPRAVALALRTVQGLDVRGLARRPLQELAREIGDDIYLGLRLGARVVYADRILGTQRISLDIRLGEPLLLHSTATGKLFAAFDDKLAAQVMGKKLVKLTPGTITDPAALAQEYERIRAQGYSKSQEESTAGVVGYAIPIRNADGQLAAAVHVSVLATRATKAHERKLLSASQACATQIERLLGNFRQDSPKARPARRSA